MTWQTDIKTATVDGPQLDAFQRFRSSTPFTLFDSSMQLNDQPLLWETSIVGGGTTTHNPDTASVDLEVTNTSGDRIIRQTRNYLRYQPGKSQLVMMSGAFDVGVANCEKYIGYFDDENGIFFKEENGQVSVGRRSNSIGSPLPFDTIVAQADWNLDKFDGFGESGYTLDPASAQIFVIDLEWLGVGRVRCGFVIKGAIHYVHEFLHANQFDGVYMSTASLPVRYEIKNTATTSPGIKLRQICASVMSEGGFEKTGFPFSASTNTTPTVIAAGQSAQVISIRPKLTFNGITNRGTVFPSTFGILSSTETIYVEIHRNAIPIGSPAPSWQSADANSIVEYDVSNALMTSGELIYAGYIAATPTGGPQNPEFPGGGERNVLSATTLSVNIDGSESAILTLSAHNLGGTPTNVFSSLSWEELF
jgi:hypothetical protein